MEEACNLTEHDFIQTADGHDLPYAAAYGMFNISIREVEEQPSHLRIDDLKEENSSPPGNVGDRLEGSHSRSEALLPRSQNHGNETERRAQSTNIGTNGSIIGGSSDRSTINGNCRSTTWENRDIMYSFHMLEKIASWVVDSS